MNHGKCSQLAPESVPQQATGRGGWSRGAEQSFSTPVAYAHKSTAKAIFKPVSPARRYLLAVQWRKSDQPTRKA